MTRVLLVSSHGADPAYGGAERYVRDLATGLLPRGHDVSVLSAFPPVGDPGVPSVSLHTEDWRESGARRLRNHMGDVVSAPWPSLGRALRAAGPDLVHTSNLPGIGTGVWEAARRLGIPVVHTLHDYHLLCPRTSLRRPDGRPCEPSPLLCGARTRRLRRWRDGVRVVVAGSQHLLDRHEGFFGDAERRVIRLPVAPVSEHPLPAPREAPPLTIGYIGALTEAKGVALILEVAPELAKRGVTVRIAGDGPLRDRVQGAPVEYAGRVDGEAKLDFLAGCDAGLVPSLWEEPSGPPYVVCEWLAAGRPLLLSRRGGLGECSALAGAVAFDPDARGLAGAVDELVGGERWTAALASAGPVTSDEDVRRWLDEHESAYERARQPAAGTVAA